VADEEEGSGDHQRLDAREGIGREVLERGDVLDPGVVDQDVDLGREVPDGRGVGEVGGVRPAPDLGGGGFGAFGVHVDDVHLGPGRREGADAGQADTAGPAGDEGGAPVQIAGHGRER
jgi:hypothetical protein